MINRIAPVVIGLVAVIGAAPAAAMKVEIDKGNYACAGDVATITVTDNTVQLPPSILVTVESFDPISNSFDTEIVSAFVQIPDPVDQIFEAVLPVSGLAQQANGNGVLDVVADGSLKATYVSGGTFEDTASTCAAVPALSTPATVLFIALMILIGTLLARSQRGAYRPSAG